MCVHPALLGHEKISGCGIILDTYGTSSSWGKYAPNLTEGKVRAALDSCGSRRIRIGCTEGDCSGRDRFAFEYRPAQTCGIAICECPACVSHRRALRLKKYRPFVCSFKNPYFLTLTLRGHYEPSKLYVDRLNRAWHMLTQRWRRSGLIEGYLKVLEVSEDEYFDACLNPVFVYTYHFHVVLDVSVCRMVDITEVRTFWKERFDSPIMRIDKVRSPHQLVRYVADYVAKAVFFTVDIHTYLLLRKMKFFSSWLKKGLKRPQKEVFMLLCPFCRSVWGFKGIIENYDKKWYFYDYGEPL